MNKTATQLIFISVFVLPMLAAAGGMLIPAFGIITLGQWQAPSLSAWINLTDTPGLGQSSLLSISSGLVATIISVVLSQAFVARRYSKGSSKGFDSLSRFLLAAPHVSVAVATAFLLAPSGWLVRLLSPWMTGWERPADYLLPNDPWAGALILGIVMKELPFMLVVSVAAINQIKPKPLLDTCQSLGYSFAQSWLFIIVPGIYKRIRLPIFIVLAFSVGAVEQALVLGPTQPPTFSIKLMQWFSDANLSSQGTLAAGSLSLILLTFLSFIVWRLLEIVITWLYKMRVSRGQRQLFWAPVLWSISYIAGLLIIIAVVSVAMLSVLSFTQGWRFPTFLPEHWSFAVWDSNIVLLLPALSQTLLLGVTAAILSVSLALVCLEMGQSDRFFEVYGKWWLFIPLFTPQVSLLFGLSLGWTLMRMDGMWLTVLWSHLIFCLPYAWLMLGDSFNAIDSRLIASARTLGASQMKTFFVIKVPLLKQQIANALALSFLVSASLYLPTLFAGGGRFSTLTIETMALAGSGDRRVLGALTLVQLMLPFIALLLAKWLPRIRLSHLRANESADTAGAMN
ncbi:hypothetical protein EYS14_18725 [Alteromonadaceae bacterium M269]|nr:hypothetical protein EYS14_18725 [Alteromonadaceae bacterium M269]